MLKSLNCTDRSSSGMHLRSTSIYLFATLSFILTPSCEDWHLSIVE